MVSMETAKADVAHANRHVTVDQVAGDSAGGKEAGMLSAIGGWCRHAPDSSLTMASFITDIRAGLCLPAFGKGVTVLFRILRSLSGDAGRATQVAAGLGIAEEHLEPYGHYKAKVSLDFAESLKDRPNGKLILVTAISPTPAGKGRRRRPSGWEMR